MAQNKPAYLIYNHKGKNISYEKMVRQLGEADIVFFGEMHNNPIAHWLELELARDLHQQSENRTLAVGAEMFERHQDPRLQLYLKGELSREEMKDTLELWRNYDTDYEPLVEYCKENQIPYFGSNVPRRYARQVYRLGPSSLDTLPSHEKQFIAPVPYQVDYDLPSYQAMKSLMGGHQMDETALRNFIASQAIKDATMAHFILQNYREGGLILHLNGSWHSDYKEGIVWYIHQHRPELEIKNITVIDQEDVHSLAKEHEGKADFYIVVPETMTKTY